MRTGPFWAAVALIANIVLSCTCERAAPPVVADGGALDATSGEDARPATTFDAAALCPHYCTIRDAIGCERTVADCPGVCAKTVAGPCGDAWAAYFECFASRSAGEFVCTDRGQPDLQPGLCTGEHDAVQRCLTR